MVSKTNAPQNHQFNKFQVNLGNEEAEVSPSCPKKQKLESNLIKKEDNLEITLELDKIGLIFHEILKSSLCIDATKRKNFEEILDYFVGAFIEVANIP